MNNWTPTAAIEERAKATWTSNVRFRLVVMYRSTPEDSSLTRNDAVLAHDHSANLCATCVYRLAVRTQDGVLPARDRLQRDELSEPLGHDKSTAVSALQIDLLDTHGSAHLEDWLQDDASMGRLGRPSGSMAPDGIINQDREAVMIFDTTQERVSRQVKEQWKILASISHDLQTPITRMRLRLERLEESAEQQKIVDDLREMEYLVREGVSYARGALVGVRVPVKIDPVAFLESLVFDYWDMGRPVTLYAPIGGHVMTCPKALRRVLGNLIDNAIKYGGSAEIGAHREAGGALCVTVSDRGPGIPESELEKVLQPFYRLAAARNSDIGGAGLGLAIAAQLTSSMKGHLMLSNRSGGGLTATIMLA